MAESKGLKNSMSLDKLKDHTSDQNDESALKRRMSSSSEGFKNYQQEPIKNDLLETYRSVSELSKKKRNPRIWNIFDWSFKTVSYDRMSPENKRWLVLYKVICYLAILLLVIAYTFFILLLFSYLIHIEQGEIVDDDLFVPVSESLLHSLSTLWKQKAYFVVGVVFLFSISLPFIKMVATILAYVITARHRKKQIHLFYGKKFNPHSRSRFSRSFSASASDRDLSGSEDVSDYTMYEDGRLIKYAREVLLILKLISKFQMVDVIILMINISFLRSAFTWAKPGKGLLYLVIYCLTSILGTQLLNLAVEGEREIFEYWRAVKLICLPVLSNYYSSYLSSHIDRDVNIVGSNLEAMSKNSAEMGTNNNMSELEVNRAVGMEMHSGLDGLGKNLIEDKASMFNYVGKSNALDVISDGSSEAEFYDMLYSSKKKDIKVRWYRCDIFVTILVLLNTVSGSMILTKEKLFGIAFTADPTKVLGLDGHQMSFFEIMSNLLDCWYYLPFFVFLFLSVVLPMLFHFLFLVGLFLYNSAISNKDFSSMSNFDPAKPLVNPCHCLKARVKATKYIFYMCNLISEWSLGEVLALGIVAGYFSLSTAYSVRFYIPPKKICSVFAMVGSFGLTSFLLNVQFFMWHNRIMSRLSDVTIYIESINSAKSETNSEVGSTTHLEAIDSSLPKLKVSINDANPNLKRIESYIEANRNEIMYQAEQADEKKNTRFRRMLFKVIDFIRHIMYSKIIISLFFLLFSFVALYCFVFSFIYTKKPARVNEAQVQNFLDTGVPQFFKIIKKNLPSSYGNCFSQVAPPKPCVGDKSAFVYEKGIKFDLIWVSGINSIQLVESNFTVTDKKRIQLSLHLSFKALRPYFKVSYSDTVDLYSGDDLCCGDDVHLVVVLSSEYTDSSPYLRDIVIENFQIRNVHLFGKLLSLMDKIASVQQFLEHRIVYYGNEYLSKHERVIRWRGLDMSPLEFVNFLVDLNYPQGLIFPDKVANAE